MIRKNSLLDPQSVEGDLAIDSNNNSLQLRSRRNDVTTNRTYNTSTVTRRDLTFGVIGILACLYGLISDCYWMIEMFETSKTVFVGILAFMVMKTIASLWINSRLRDQIDLHVQAQAEDEEEDDLERVAELRPNSDIDDLCQLAWPRMWVKCRSLRYAWKVRTCEKKGDEDGLDHYYPKMRKEQAIQALLNVVNCFLESAPLLVLQLTMLLMDGREIPTEMWFTLCCTLCTLGWSVMEYHCAIRLAQPDSAVVSVRGKAMLCIWHSCFIAARVLAIVVAAISWPSYTLLACTVNWIAWICWIHVTDNVDSILHGKKADSKFGNLLLASVMALVYTFTFIDLGKGRTFGRNLFYHIVCLLQNGIVFVLWVMLINPKVEYVGFSQVLLIVSVILFPIGIGAMVAYYKFFHPTLKNESSNLNARDCVTCV